VDLFWLQDAALFQDALLLGGERRALDGSASLKAAGLAACKLHDFFGDPYRAPIVAAHGTKVRIHIEIFVVESPSGIGVKR
jgi:hypothetical protein